MLPTRRANTHTLTRKINRRTNENESNNYMLFHETVFSILRIEEELVITIIVIKYEPAAAREVHLPPFVPVFFFSYSLCSPYLPLHLPASLFNSFSGCFMFFFSFRVPRAHGVGSMVGRYAKHEYSSLDFLMYSFIRKILLCVHRSLQFKCEEKQMQYIII